MAALTFVKWGGSLITDKATPYTVRRDVLKRLADELARYWPAREGGLVLGHGSGSFGHEAARASGFVATDDAPPSAEAFSAVQHAAARLHRGVMAALREAGLPVVSLVPSSSLLATDGQPTHVPTDILEHVLAQGALPVTYGDVLIDRTEGSSIASTETLFRALIPALRAAGHPTARALWFGDTDGLYDATGTTIPTVAATEASELLDLIGAPRGVDVTGGMAHRVQTVAALAAEGVPSVLANGHRAGAMHRLLRGDTEDPVTHIRAR
jgi:isopentenyl phosphate kinase